jgi:membrane protease YdiL (CAAX protease family)
MKYSNKNTWQIVGPILASALSLFISTLILQWIGSLLFTDFYLLSRGGIGKIAFSVMVFVQIILLFSTQSKSFVESFLQNTILFFKNKKWITPFCKLFCLFFFAHALFIVFLYTQNILVWNQMLAAISSGTILKTAVAFIAVFTLAWSEEAIFRGGIFAYFAQHLSSYSAAFITSLIFMFSHRLETPWTLITSEWKLGLGLFLLGLMLNLIFITTKQLWYGMGSHAGLVGVKVFLRKIPFLIPATSTPFWFHDDLRQSLLVHCFFAGICLFLIIRYRKNSQG